MRVRSALQSDKAQTGGSLRRCFFTPLQSYRTETIDQYLFAELKRKEHDHGEDAGKDQFQCLNQSALMQSDYAEGLDEVPVGGKQTKDVEGQGAEGEAGGYQDQEGEDRVAVEQVVEFHGL